MAKTNKQKSTLPAQMPVNQLGTHLKSISQTLRKLIDVDIFTWLEEKKKPYKEEKERIQAGKEWRNKNNGLDMGTQNQRF